MHKFEGFGTTHFVVTDEATGGTMSLKLRIHSFMLKMEGGQVRLHWEEFMRDKLWQPQDSPGWPVFKQGAHVDLANLVGVPTKPVANFEEVEKRVKVNTYPS